MSTDTKEHLGLGACFAVIVVVVSLLLGGAIYADGGRTGSDGDHYEALPQGAVMLTAQDYLVNDRSINPGSICLGVASSGDSPVKTVTTSPGLNGAEFIVCDQGQRWSDHRAHSISFGDGIAALVQKPAYEIPVGIAVIVCLFPGVLSGTGDLRRWRRERKFRAAKVEDERRELRVSYAKEEITQAQFEDGLNRLYKLGAKRESASV